MSEPDGPAPEEGLPGPLPARTDRPREAAARVLSALVETSEPLSVVELTAVVGGHPNNTRNHLEQLESQGFVASVTRPGKGRGRPARAYQPTVAGRQVAGQDDRWADLALLEAVADQLATSADPAGAASDIGRAWGRRLAADDLVDLLTRQGFTPVEAEPDGGLRLLTCPLLAAARRRPDIVCSLHQGLVDAIAQRPMRLVPFGASDGCLLLTSDALATGS